MVAVREQMKWKEKANLLSPKQFQIKEIKTLILILITNNFNQ